LHPELSEGSTFRSSTASTIRPVDDQGADELDILILGPVPPPYGGISVHLSRLVPLLENAGLKVGVLNHFASRDEPFVVGALNRNPVNYYRMPNRFPARIVHYHHSRWPQFVALVLGKRGNEAHYILTLHAGDLEKHFPELRSRNPLVRTITRWALRRFDTVIAVDPEIAEIIRGELPDRRVELLPAFVDFDGEEARSYIAEVESFLDSGPFLVMAAYSIQFLKSGEELYGVDTAIEAFLDLAPDYDDLRLAIFVARSPTRGKARSHLARLEQRLVDARVQDRVLILFGQPLVPALRETAVFVRPTRAEGDAVSVREAQRAGVPVVASDIIARPDGVVLFPAGSGQGLSTAVRSVLNGRHVARSPGGNRAEPEDEPFVEKLLAVYRGELASRVAREQHDRSTDQQRGLRR